MSSLSPSTIARLRKAAANAVLTDAGRLWLEDADTIEAWLPACLEAQAARVLTEDGDHFAAYDLAAMGLEHARRCGFPTTEFERLQAVALARSGSTKRAQEIIERLLQDENADALSFGVLARTYRDLGEAAGTKRERRAFFGQAADWAEKGWARTSKPATLASAADHAYLANQVAQFALLAGDGERSKKFQRVVQETWDWVRGQGGEAKLDGTGLFWWHTNLAEMAVLRGDIDAAREHYSQMRRSGAQRMGDVAANARVCRLLLGELERDPQMLAESFALPPIAVFSGHMFDAPGRSVPRMPESRADAVKAQLARALDDHMIAEGFASSSAGADILFAEALVERGAKLTLILPFSRGETRARCVEPRGVAWCARFDRLLDCAHRVKELQWARLSGHQPVNAASEEDDSLHHAYANKVMMGLARLRAQMLGVKLQPLVVWDRDERSEALPGGTSDFVRFCRELGTAPFVVDSVNPSAS